MDDPLRDVYEWVPTHNAAVPGNLDRVPAYVGDHLWTWTAVFQTTPESGQPLLDGENLIRMAGPTCYYCQYAYSRLLVGRLCRGSAAVRV